MYVEDEADLRMGDALRGRPRYDGAGRLESLRAFVAERDSGM